MHGGEDGFLVAYFSLEFGVDESLPIYSGGLGVLAGDHLKASSDLGVPLVGVGPLYRDGYFRQRLDEAGRQAEDAQPVDPEALGLVRETTVEVELGGERVEAVVWRHDVGRVPLYLLDAPGITDGSAKLLRSRHERRNDAAADGLQGSESGATYARQAARHLQAQGRRAAVWNLVSAA